MNMGELMAKIDQDKLIRRQQELLALFSRAPIKKSMGMEFRYEGDSAVFDLPYNSGFDHALNDVHGGAIATLLDNAGWFTVAQYYDSWVSTAEMQIRLVKPALRAHLQSRGRILTLGKRVAMAEMEVKNQDGTLVAVGSGTFVVTTMSTGENKG
jgi:uncharacterized protein (TIGR00369 family)